MSLDPLAGVWRSLCRPASISRSGALSPSSLASWSRPRTSPRCSRCVLLFLPSHCIIDRSHFHISLMRLPISLVPRPDRGPCPGAQAYWAAEQEADSRRHAKRREHVPGPQAMDETRACSTLLKEYADRAPDKRQRRYQCGLGPSAYRRSSCLLPSLLFAPAPPYTILERVLLRRTFVPLWGCRSASASGATPLTDRHVVVEGTTHRSSFRKLSRALGALASRCPR